MKIFLIMTLKLEPLALMEGVDYSGLKWLWAGDWKKFLRHMWILLYWREIVEL